MGEDSYTKLVGGRGLEQGIYTEGMGRGLGLRFYIKGRGKSLAQNLNTKLVWGEGFCTH